MSRSQRCRFQEKSGPSVGRSRLFWAFSRASNSLPALNVPDSDSGFQHRVEGVRRPLPDPSGLAFVRLTIGRIGRLLGWSTRPGSRPARGKALAYRQGAPCVGCADGNGCDSKTVPAGMLSARTSALGVRALCLDASAVGSVHAKRLVWCYPHKTYLFTKCAIWLEPPRISAFT